MLEDYDEIWGSSSSKFLCVLVLCVSFIGIVWQQTDLLCQNDYIASLLIIELTWFKLTNFKYNCILICCQITKQTWIDISLFNHQIINIYYFKTIQFNHIRPSLEIQRQQISNQSTFKSKASPINFPHHQLTIWNPITEQQQP